MTIESTSGGTMIEGDSDIALYRLCTLKVALKLEIAGMHRRGRSAYSIIKSEFGFRGNKQRVLTQLQALIEQKGAERAALLISTQDTQ
jgi:hypothetical protein